MSPTDIIISLVGTLLVLCLLGIASNHILIRRNRKVYRFLLDAADEHGWDYVNDSLPSYEQLVYGRPLTPLGIAAKLPPRRHSIVAILGGHFKRIPD